MLYFHIVPKNFTEIVHLLIVGSDTCEKDGKVEKHCLIKSSSYWSLNYYNPRKERESIHNYNIIQQSKLSYIGYQ